MFTEQNKIVAEISGEDKYTLEELTNIGTVSPSKCKLLFSLSRTMELPNFHT